MVEYLSPEEAPPAPRTVDIIGRWLGIVSILIGTASIATLMGMITLVVALTIDQAGAPLDSTSSGVLTGALIVICLVPLAFVGGLFGGIGAILNRRQWWLGLIGVALNALYVAGFIFLLLIGTLYAEP